MEVISLCEMEVSPIEILSIMKDNIYKHYDKQSIININKAYILQRKSLISLINKISSKMGFKSQTFFLAVNYLDIIFSKDFDILYNYNLLAIGCLIIASKFCENVPLRPIFKYFVNLYNTEITDDNYKVTKEDLFEYEIIICKILDYKLNYFTIYDFNFFFFGNGIIKIEQLKEISYDISSMNKEKNINSSINTRSSSKIKKILIKIYERSRHYLDKIIENLICLKYNSLLISICIMEKSIDYALLNEFNLQNSNDLIDIEEFKFNNKQYFKNVMKEFYKIDFETLPEYQDLKIECENYKLFEDINDKNSMRLNENNKYNTGNKKKLILENSSSKNINIIKDASIDQSPLMKNKNGTKEKIHYLYRKVNIPIIFQNNNMSNIRRKKSPDNRKSISRENKFHFNEKKNTNNINTNLKKRTTLNDFYQKSQSNFRNSISINKKNNYLKKTNTSSSPFRNVSHFNSSCNKSKIINRIKTKERYDGSKEGHNNSNSKNKYLKRNNVKKKLKNNINLSKPYIKKVIQNYEKIQDDNNKKNININININNKILYGGTIQFKERNKSSKRDFNSKYLDRSNHSLIRGKSIVNKSKIEKENTINKNFESSPFYEKNYSNFMPFQFNFNKKNLLINENNTNSIYLQKTDNINKDLNDNNNNNNKSNNIYISNYNLYNSNYSTRNSFQFNDHNQKLANSFVNINMNYLNNDPKDKNISSPEEFMHIDNIKNNGYINDYNSLNLFKNKNNLFNERNNDINRINNTMKNMNYNEGNKHIKIKNFNYHNDSNNSINFNVDGIKEFNEDQNYIGVKNINTDGRHKNASNINILDYSTGISNEKNIF